MLTKATHVEKLRPAGICSHGKECKHCRQDERGCVGMVCRRWTEQQGKMKRQHYIKMNQRRATGAEAPDGDHLLMYDFSNQHLHHCNYKKRLLLMKICVFNKTCKKKFQFLHIGLKYCRFYRIPSHCQILQRKEQMGIQAQTLVLTG